MGYQLRVHHEIRDWLIGLRGTEPELARLVGEAVLALLDAGEALGPPLAVPLESVLRSPEDPSEALDFSYQRQLEALTKVRRGVADVATSRKRVELTASTVERQATKLASQRADAVTAGRADLASEAQDREARLREQLAGLRRRLAALTAEEERLTVASQRLQAMVEAFRVRKETINAGYTAAEAAQTVRQAIAEISEDAGLLAVPTAAEDVSSGAGGTRDPGDELLREIRDSAPAAEGGAEPAGHVGTPAPPGMMELRPGAPGDVRAGLLYLIAPGDTAVVVAYVRNPGGPVDEYQAVLQLATARLTAAESRPEAAAGPAAFTSYDAESFLDEFFAGEETEVEIGASALVARSRAHTLAEARQRMRLTQAQVARRMDVRQERVSAIERAEPGATEVRTLAAYVRALGGRLEIIAHVGDERITLR